jgi:uncharacterized protein (DUF1330 family)
MKISPRLGLVLALAFASLAAPAVHAQPAQVKAPLSKGAFVLFEFDVKDPATFKTLATEIRASLKDFKGEFVMREKVQSLFGGAPSNLSVISFPAVADARAWLASSVYTGLKADRDKAADVRSYLVEKLD